MTQLSILKGIYSDPYARLRESYPVNLAPIVAANGVSNGQLRAAPGITLSATGPGRDRGAVLFKGVQYRIMGSKLCKVVGATITQLGDVGDDGLPVSLACSFDYLGVVSAGGFYLCNGATVTHVTDPDLGTVSDLIWIDGYFMLTDGTYLIVTELDDPTSIDPLKYGTSEADPDPVTGLMKVRNEAYAVNRYTIENFQNRGGTGFPFQRNQGGLIPKGCVGHWAKAYFLETFAFVGGSENEAPSVYVAANGSAESISTPEIDRELGALNDTELSAVEVEAKIDQDEQQLLIHLPTKTLVYSHQATQAAQTPVWHKLASGVLGDGAYPGKHLVLDGGMWIVGAADGRIGYLDETVETQFGATAGWWIYTSWLYNGGKGGILKALELVAITGAVPLGVDPTAFLSLTVDGRTWGQERAISMGLRGDMAKRLQWRPKRRFQNYVGVRFRGSNTALASFLRLEAEIEPLNV